MIKKNIIKKNYEFQDIIKTKQQVVTKFLVLYYRKNDKFLRIGISISKKFANAVYRNKYRRQTRNCLDIINKWKIKYDVVLILRKPFLNLDFTTKQIKLSKILERI